MVHIIFLLLWLRKGKKKEIRAWEREKGKSYLCHLAFEMRKCGSSKVGKTANKDCFCYSYHLFFCILLLPFGFPPLFLTYKLFEGTRVVYISVYFIVILSPVAFCLFFSFLTSKTPNLLFVSGMHKESKQH